MTKTNTRSRIVSILLVLAMLLTMVPINAVTASAATTGDGTKGNPFVVNTYEDWKEKMELPGEKYITLGADIDTSTMNGGIGLGPTDFVSMIGRSHLDLNGKKLTLKKSIIDSGGKIQFIRLAAGELIIEDSKGGGEIVGVNKVTKRYMRLIDVVAGAKLTLNSGRLYLETTPDNSVPNATICSMGTVEINGGTVSISKFDGQDEATGDVNMQNFALQTIYSVDDCYTLINGGTFDGRVLLNAVAKASGVADNVITGGDFKKSIYIQKDKDVTGDVPLNVSIQGGTYHYTPGYYTRPANDPLYPGRKASDPAYLFQFATQEFTEKGVGDDGPVYNAFRGGSLVKNPDKYDMNAFASMFPKNAIITAEGQEYDHLDVRDDEPTHIIVNDAAFTGSSSALDLARLVDSHYKTITVTTLPEDALKDMKLTVGDGTPLPAKGNSTVSGDVTLGSDGTLTKNVYISAIGNKQLKKMYYSNPSKIDFGYRLNIFKDGERVDYTGVISQTYAAVGDEISVSVQLPNFKFEEGVYTFRLGLHSDLRGSEAQIGKTLVGLWKLTAKEAVDLPIDSVALNVPELKVGDTSGDFTLSGTNTGVSAVTTEWKDIPATGAVESTDYSAFVRLKAENGYVFDANTNVTLIGDYWGSNTGISSDGKTMTVLVGVRILHKHTFGEWKDLGNSEYHVRNCSCLAQEKEPHNWEYVAGDKYKCTVCGHTIDGEKERITYVYASPRSPIAGERPGDYTPAEWVKISGANYKVKSIVWKNEDGSDVEKFESGKIYTGTVTFKAETGFVFAQDKILADRIFSSDVENVGNYTLNTEATILTANFKLKDNTVVRPGLQVKVKLPTLNDKIGQSFPAAELVDTTLPDDVEFTSSVYENIFEDPITGSVKPNKTYLYVVNLQFKNSSNDIIKAYNVSYTVTDGGDAEYHTDNLAGYGILARYQTPDTSKINSVALTVTAPKYGEVPATTANGANDTRYTVGTPTWSPAVTDGKFGAAAYTVSIPVTAAEGYSFDANCVYTVNGYVATYADGKVSYTFPALTAPHKHNYGTWTMLDDSQHSRSCTCGDMQFEAHTFSAWTKVDESTHSRTCSKCKKSGEATNYTETAEHTWVWVVDQEAALGQPGRQHEECTGCHAKRSENTEIPALRDYAVTVTGGTATVAAGTPITRAMEGVEVTVTAQAPAGTHFVKWVVKAGGVTLANETSATTTFIMPANDVTIEAEIAENPVESYTLTVIKGTASVAAGTPITDKIAQNTVVTVTADAPETGKVFDKWVVLEGNVTLTDATKATTTFTMPGNDVKIEATYKDAPPSHSVYVGMTYTAGNFIYQITSIDTATLGQSKVIGVVAAKKNKITKITIPDRADCKGYRLNVTAVGDKAFKSMKKLKKVTFGSNVKVIGKNAFSNCKKLNKISFKNITTIGNNAFAGCKALEKLTIGNKVTVIGKNAFKECSKLETVVIGKAVKTISSKAFIGDNKIKKITFKGKKLKTVKKDAFSKKAKKNIKSKKTKLKGNKKAIKLFKKKLKIK